MCGGGGGCLLHHGGGFTYKGGPPTLELLFSWNVRGNYATKSTLGECAKRLCLGCVDDRLAAGFPKCFGRRGRGEGGGGGRSTVPKQDIAYE